MTDDMKSLEIRVTRKCLSASKHWSHLMDYFDSEVTRKTGAIDMKEWSDSDHDAVRRWASEGGHVPKIILVYISKLLVTEEK